MDWRRLEADPAFRELYDRQGGAIGREIADLESQILGVGVTDPVQLATLKAKRWGLLRVREQVSELAHVEDEARKIELIEQAAALSDPAKSPFPRNL